MEMANMAEFLRQARENEDLSSLSKAIPYLDWLGMSVHKDADGLYVELAYSEKLIGNPTLPALHGGVTGALLETAAVFEVIRHTTVQRLPKIINLTVDYARPGRPRTTFARGNIIRHGRRVVTVVSEAWQESAEKPIGRALSHFLIT